MFIRSKDLSNVVPTETTSCWRHFQVILTPPSTMPLSRAYVRQWSPSTDTILWWDLFSGTLFDRYFSNHVCFRRWQPPWTLGLRTISTPQQTGFSPDMIKVFTTDIITRNSEEVDQSKFYIPVPDSDPNIYFTCFTWICDLFLITI